MSRLEAALAFQTHIPHTLFGLLLSSGTLLGALAHYAQTGRAAIAAIYTHWSLAILIEIGETVQLPTVRTHLTMTHSLGSFNERLSFAYYAIVNELYE